MEIKKKILHLGVKRRVSRDREQQKRQKQRGKEGIDGGLTKACAVLGCAWCSIDC